MGEGGAIKSIDEYSKVMSLIDNLVEPKFRTKFDAESQQWVYTSDKGVLAAKLCKRPKAK